jgi:hypothetical protein
MTDRTLATQQNAAPPLVIEADHAVRDIRATLSQGATGYDVVVDVLQNGTLYQTVTIPAGQTSSGIIPGVNLPPLKKEQTLTMNVTLNVHADPAGPSSPGRDLTVTIRL